MKAAKKASRTYAARQAAHFYEATTGHQACKPCKCPLAKKGGFQCCLDYFGKGAFLSFHHDYYGSALGRMDASTGTRRRKKQTRFDKVPANGLGNNLHHEMWAKKTPLDKAAVGGNGGRMYRVVSWALNGRAVCRAAWKAARGGSEREHRDLCKRTLDLSSPLACASRPRTVCACAGATCGSYVG